MIKDTAAYMKPHAVCEGVRQRPPVSQVKTKITAKATMGIGLSAEYKSTHFILPTALGAGPCYPHLTGK